MEQVVHLEWTIKVFVPSYGTFSGYYAGSSTKANPFKAEGHPPEPVQKNDSTGMSFSSIERHTLPAQRFVARIISKVFAKV